MLIKILISIMTIVIVIVSILTKEDKIGNSIVQSAISLIQLFIVKESQIAKINFMGIFIVCIGVIIAYKYRHKLDIKKWFIECVKLWGTIIWCLSYWSDILLGTIYFIGLLFMVGCMLLILCMLFEYLKLITIWLFKLNY